MDAPPVSLRIRRLLLSGFPPAEAARVRDAFAAALSRELAADPGLAARLRPAASEKLNLPPLAPGGSPEAIARKAARSLLKGLAP